LPPSVSRFTFPSANNTFAASFGGSGDYRLTDRLPSRIVQPGVLFTRSGSRATNNGNQYTFRLSTGVVFTSGVSSFNQSSGPHFSFGVIGGVALTDAFGHDSAGFFIGTDGAVVLTRSRSYSTLKDYVIGPML